MIFESLTVENWRGFYGIETIRFSTSKEKNTTIVYAQNGIGKTNLLNAIMWCLYEELTSSFKKPSDILNHEAARRGRKSYHVTIYLRSDNNQLYKISRSGGKQSGFAIHIISDDGNQTPLPGSAKLFVNSILPRDMAGYFINDGEGDDLTSDENGMISISRSIEDILGFRMAQRAIEDVASIRREFYGQWKKLNKEEELSSDIENLETLQEELDETKCSLVSDQDILSRYEIDIGKINTQMGNSNIPVLKAKQADRASTERSLDRAKSNLKEFRNKKKSLIKSYATASFSAKIKDSDLNFLSEENLKGKFPGDFNQQLVTDILARNECLCGTKICDGTKEFEALMALRSSAADSETLHRLQNARAKITQINTLSQSINQSIVDNFNNCDREERRIDRLEKKLEELSSEIDSSGVENAEKLEKERRILKGKISNTLQAIGRSKERIEKLNRDVLALKSRIKNVKAITPVVEQLNRKMYLCDEIISDINSRLKSTREDVLVNLQIRIDEFLDTYLQQDYSVRITEDKKIGLTDRYGNFIAPSEGQSAILKFIYISTLVSIAREHRDVDTNIFTAGAIAPLLFDAPFSKLQASYAINVANTLPSLVDQLVIIMYQDSSKPIDEILKINGKLGKIYCFNQKSQGSKKENDITEIMIDGVSKTIASYDQEIDLVKIEEVKSYV
jgi:DNA sulfur modification protein DndD